MDFSITCYNHNEEEVMLKGIVNNPNYKVAFSDDDGRTLLTGLPINIGSFLESWRQGKYDGKGITHAFIYHTSLSEEGSK